MAIPVIQPSRDEVLGCLARFDDLPMKRGGLPDADLPGYERGFRVVLGFVPPDEETGGRVSPVPSSMKAALSHLRTGYGLAYVSVEPGQAVMMHNHDTIETFVVMEGKFRMMWEGAEGYNEVDVGPLDLLSFPAGLQRSFRCIETAPGKDAGILMGIISGEQPAAEYSPEAVKELIAAGRLQPAA